jgi:hypothetical protein
MQYSFGSFSFGIDSITFVRIADITLGRNRGKVSCAPEAIVRDSRAPADVCGWCFGADERAGATKCTLVKRSRVSAFPSEGIAV